MCSTSALFTGLKAVQLHRVSYNHSMDRIIMQLFMWPSHGENDRTFAIISIGEVKMKWHSPDRPGTDWFTGLALNHLALTCVVEGSNPSRGNSEHVIGNLSQYDLDYWKGHETRINLTPMSLLGNIWQICPISWYTIVSGFTLFSLWMKCLHF